jgi:hypothetical protein
MAACTERHPAGADNGAAGEGQKDMTREGSVMAARTERYTTADTLLASEGQKDMTKEAQ